MKDSFAYRVLGLVAVPLWLPLAVLVGLAVRSGHELTVGLAIHYAGLLAPAWLWALPLSLAIRLLWNSSRALALVYAAVLGPLTVVAIFGGLYWQPDLGLAFSGIIFLALGGPEIMLQFADLTLELSQALATTKDGVIYLTFALAVSLPAWAAWVVVSARQSGQPSTVTRTTVFRVLAFELTSLWLPLALLAITIMYYGASSPLLSTNIALRAFGTVFVVAWLTAHPLTLAVFLLHRNSRVFSLVVGVTLGALTVVFVPESSPAGPLGVMLFASVIALPAWVLVGAMAYVQRHKTRPSSVASG